ncbi:MAG TPA: 50S ribosomal protein L29 [Patescibacteria group bacterium]|jgi:ribosomal protein L29
MAEVRKAKPTTTQATAAPKQQKKAASSKRSPAGAAEIRQELGKLRRDHRMQQLDSPAKLRQTRRTLARELTKERAVKLQEANG